MTFLHVCEGVEVLLKTATISKGFDAVLTSEREPTNSDALKVIFAVEFALATMTGNTVNS